MRIFLHYCNKHVIYLVIPIKPWGICLLLINYTWLYRINDIQVILLSPWNLCLYIMLKKDNSLHFHIPVQKQNLSLGFWIFRHDLFYLYFFKWILDSKHLYWHWVSIFYIYFDYDYHLKYYLFIDMYNTYLCCMINVLFYF